MSEPDGKDCYREMVASVREKRDQLPPNGFLRGALPDSLLDSVLQHIESNELKDLRYGYWPPALGIVDYYPVNVLKLFEADIAQVVQASGARMEKQLPQFLQAGPRDKLGPWYGGLFDVWAKTTALKSGLPVQLDYMLPNGRDHDIRIVLGDRPFHIENTVITQDDESQDVWDRFLVDKRLDPKKVLIRPGAYCPVDAKGPSPYYDALRVYAKVFDKIAKNLDPAKSQCANGEPNVLLLSFAGPGVSPESPAVGWVLDELFADQPRMVHTVAPDGITDISLDAWIDFTATDYIRRGSMTVEFYCENFRAIMEAPRRLGGIMLFDGARLAGSRANYNADEGCRISHGEMVQLEQLFGAGSPYWL